MPLLVGIAAGWPHSLPERYTGAVIELLPLLLLFFLGLALGSFGNVLAWRLPRDESVLGRSRCPHCKRTLGAIDLVPLLSYVWLGGRCRTCRKRIGARYPLLELGGGLLGIAAYFLAPTFLGALLLCGALLALLVIAVIDGETQMIPDVLSITVIVLALAFRLEAGYVAVGGALVGLAVFGGQWLISRGRWLGSGDVFLSVGLGLLVGGAGEMMIAVLSAYIIGAMVALLGLATGGLKRTDRLAFGPFLACGAAVSLLLSPIVLPWLVTRGW